MRANDCTNMSLYRDTSAGKNFVIHDDTERCVSLAKSERSFAAGLDGLDFEADAANCCRRVVL